ncbi:MAG TPA: AI-2E family transporter [Candidatus Paenalcaligenes intestinipullorum]|uniref:AI-2E family transporter n=1 Tax=Candidatus Paenalcaligenes intestinipullorum TaxID=2838718 RepID=A0A9D2RID9_9BURK|nr:AI-2E family transporter [Candidatus Paenalcaligenes intestinipullorum]
MQPMFPASSLARWLLLIVLLTGLYFLKDFLVPVLAALIIGLASWPLYKRLLRRCDGRNTLAATIAILIVVVVLIVPLSYGLAFTIREVISLIEWAREADRSGVPMPDWLLALPFVGPRIVEYWDTILGQPQALGAAVQAVSGEHLGSISRMVASFTTNAVQLLLTLLFLLITLFFIYKDGQRILQQLDVVGERVLPQRWQRFSRVVPATISSTVTGMGLIAIGEGVVLGIAYALAGAPSPILLGAITGFMALIPGGAPLSFTLVSLYLIGNPHTSTISGVALFLWGAIELFIVDKTLRPRLVGGPVKLPFLPTFFGLVGGVKTMGIIGLFVGPVLMALLVAIWREWVLEARTQPVSPGLLLPMSPQLRTQEIDEEP